MSEYEREWERERERGVERESERVLISQMIITKPSDSTNLCWNELLITEFQS